ncbi:MAG: XdhC family protein [Pseudomonadota bacterium]
MAPEHDRIPEIALEWHSDGQGAVLATVIETWGSAPRPVGAQMVVSGEGRMMGSVSGGCVEGAVVVEAQEALETGTCRVLEFGVADEEAFAVGLACGGRIRVLVEPVGLGDGWGVEMLSRLVAARAAREPLAVETVLDGFARRLVEADAGEVSAVNDQTFRHVHAPPLRLAIVGAVHIAQSLAVMAQLAGYDVAVIDPRAAFGSAARFPGERLIEAWPDAALAEFGLDGRTAVVTLTHDPKLDDPALLAALPSAAFYVGALGSTRTHAKRVARLSAAGLTAAHIARIDAPVGLDIGAKSPAEIAVATLAEMTERLRRPATRPGRSAKDAA